MGTARSRPPWKQGFPSPSPIRFSRRTPSSADAVILRRRSIRLHAVACAVLLLVLWASPVHAQSGALAASAAVTQLADFDAAKRTAAACALRRMPDTEAAPALFDAIAKHPDEYARYRAFVLLVSFNDPRTAEVARGALTDKNDRLREAA